MAGDEVLLMGAVAGVASLRFYGWQEATVSLGYFQAAACRDAVLATLPFVRRPTGGGALVHHHELTYALALPAEHLGLVKGSWLVRMHRVVARALQGYGIDIRQESTCSSVFADDALCFRRWARGDLILAGHKVVGSAQRKQRQCLLQHGAVLLRASPHVPHLQGIRDLCGVAVAGDELQAAIAAELARETGWELVPGPWAREDSGRRDELVAGRYATPPWNEKR